MLLANSATLKKAVWVLAICVFIAMPTRVWAQSDPVLDDDLELPCGGDDPYATECPLDTWTFILVVGGVIFGAASIYVAQKRADRVANIKYMDPITDINKSA